MLPKGLKCAESEKRHFDGRTKGQRVQIEKGRLVTLQSVKPRVPPFREQDTKRSASGVFQSLLKALPDNQLGEPLLGRVLLRMVPRRPP